MRFEVVFGAGIIADSNDVFLRKLSRMTSAVGDILDCFIFLSQIYLEKMTLYISEVLALYGAQ